MVITGSQKALMVPPGLALVSVSDKAWKAVEKSQSRRFYWDFQKAAIYHKDGYTPFTPSVSLVLGLNKSIKLIHKEGLQNVFKKHILLSKAFRKGIQSMGLELFADELNASPTITSVVTPDNVRPGDLRKTLEKNYGVFVAGGQQKLKDRIIRVGHMGYIDKLDIISTLWALGMALREHGSKVDIPLGINDAQKVLQEV